MFLCSEKGFATFCSISLKWNAKFNTKHHEAFFYKCVYESLAFIAFNHKHSFYSFFFIHYFPASRQLIVKRSIYFQLLCLHDSLKGCNKNKLDKHHWAVNNISWVKVLYNISYIIIMLKKNKDIILDWAESMQSLEQLSVLQTWVLKKKIIK